ncbi:hypothetical protein [Nocardioides campestrisoli]|uniref:hypothetical protein n=1 Tax=Nocardioides campestrisoli TaxID=2736757 RepID=UPI00163DBC3C|nr:hypothetical protein [Nocardioides campestrisoli]
MTQHVTVTVVDLDSEELVRGQHAIAGAAQPAAIVMLGADPSAGTRTVLVEFPDGWSREATGHQPAGEEMVVLSGALTISGLTCGVGQSLVVEPHATRSATSTTDGTRAVVWFSGPGGGWADGEAEQAGAAEVLAADETLDRGPRAGLVGTLRGLASAAGLVFDTDVDVLWPQARRWADVPAGTPVPDVAGPAIVHTR